MDARLVELTTGATEYPSTAGNYFDKFNSSIASLSTTLPTRPRKRTTLVWTLLGEIVRQRNATYVLDQRKQRTLVISKTRRTIRRRQAVTRQRAQKRPPRGIRPHITLQDADGRELTTHVAPLCAPSRSTTRPAMGTMGTKRRRPWRSFSLNFAPLRAKV